MTNDILDIKKRFKEVRNALKVSQKELAEAINVDKTIISRIESTTETKRLPTLGIMIALTEVFRVNRLYIETGEGEMFLKNQESERTMILEKTEGYIPVYDVTFTLGFTPTFLHSQNEPEILGYVNFPELRGSTYVVKAKGNSMSPMINDRDFVGIRPVKNKRIIDYGNPYGIITEDLAVFKKVKKFKDDENRILLTSENPEYESFDIEKKDVLQLFSVIGVLSVKSITY